MENITRALEIAAGMLISLLVIGMLVFGYNKLSSIKQTEEDNEKIEKAGDFNKDYETYNKNGIYGSELLSLANKIEDYNSKNPEEDGYEKITLEIKINQITKAEVYKATSYDSKTITQCYDTLSKKITEANKTIKGKKVSYWAGSSTEVRKNFTTTSNPTYAEIRTYIQTYNALVTERDDITRKSFKCTYVEYSKDNGRVIKMKFEEK